MIYRCNPEEHPCGQCDACCVVFRIEEFEKPQFERCEHLGSAEHGACTIYEHRPAVCCNYQCAYLAARQSPYTSDFLPAFLEDDFRPDKVGIVFDRGYPLGEDNEIIEGTSIWPKAHKSPAAVRLFKLLSRINPVLIEAVRPSRQNLNVMEPFSYHWFLSMPEMDHLIEKIKTAMRKMKQQDPDDDYSVFMHIFENDEHTVEQLI